LNGMLHDTIILTSESLPILNAIIDFEKNKHSLLNLL